MKLTCLKKDLAQAVDMASRMVSMNQNMPVLQCLVFQVSKNHVVVQATNLEISTEIKITGTVEEEGVVAVPAQIISSVLKTTPNGQKVTLATSDNTLTVTIEKSVNTIKTIPHDDFPRIPKPEQGAQYEIQTTNLINGFRSVLYSASTSLIKPELAGVYVYSDNNFIHFVATDSFRLAEKRIENTTGNDIPEVIMPARNVVEFVRVLEMCEQGEARVFVEDNQYSAEVGNVFITARIIDGTFPDYTAIIPKTFSTEAVMLKEDFASALKKAQIFSDKFSQVIFSLSPNKKLFEISAQNSMVGEVHEPLDAAITGEELHIKFNHKFILDSLQSIKTDSVSLSFAGNNKPVVIKGVGDVSFMYLVMPMNK